LAARGLTVYCPRPLTGFRIHPLSQSLVGAGQVEEVRRQLEFVLQKHFGAWAGHSPARPEVRRAACFGLELNVELLAGSSGRRLRWLDLARHFLRLDPACWHRFIRDSRIWERVLARLRAGLIPHGSILALLTSNGVEMPPAF